MATKRKKHKRKNALYSLDQYKARAITLGVSNPEILDTFNPDGRVIKDHKTCINKIEMLQAGNKFSALTHARQKVERERQLMHARNWLNTKGVKLA